MDRLEELKDKYRTVLAAITQKGVRLDHLHVQDNKLFMQGAAPNQDVKNSIWNQIKAVDSDYGDLLCDLRIDASLPQPAPEKASNNYEVKPGDSLWKIAQRLYGNGALFQRIIDANPEKLKDATSVIHPGDVLNIPAL